MSTEAATHEDLLTDVRDEIAKVIVGQDSVVDGLLVALIVGGHALLEGVPGTAKTLLATTLAATLDLDVRRVQFTPDLMPSDLIGRVIYRQETGQFAFHEGPLFTNLLIGDEINRTPPKTQAALLEAMQERQVSVEGHTRELPQPFLVVATQNPVEYEGTYPLPEAQLDRFMVRTSFGYPSSNDEWDVLQRRMQRRREEQDLRQVTDASQLTSMQQAVERVTVDESVGRYCVALTTATRSHPHVLMGASPRGALGLLLTSRALAIIAGRDYVTPEDVKAIADPVLAHRITVKPEMWMSQISGHTVVDDVVSTVPTPATLEPSRDQP